MAKTLPVSVFILTRNEEEKIRDALKSVAWADEIVLIDSFSTDQTVAIAKKHGAKVIQLKFDGFGKLRNAGLEHTHHEWIFSLDSDERCTEGLHREIAATIVHPDAADAYLVPRHNFFLGRWIRHGGWHPNYRQPQLFRRGRLTFPEGDLVHEGYQLAPGARLERLRNHVWQVPYRNLSEALGKMERYSSLSAEKLARAGRTSSYASAFARGVWSFLRAYFLKLGFLDGGAGIVIATLAFENSFHKHAKRASREALTYPAKPPLA